MLRKYIGLETIIIIIYLSVIFLPVLFETFGLNFEESTSPNDYVRITDVDYKATLLDEEYPSGKVFITETITFNIHAANENNLYWELWRELPEKEVDGLKVDYDVISVKEINDDGTKTEWVESPKLYWDDSDYISSTYGPGKWFHSKGPYSEYLRNYECLLFYIDGVYRDTMTFEIQYVMNNAALSYKDVSELYLIMYSGETIKHLNSFKAEISIPLKDMPSKDNYLVRSYGTNSHTIPVSESTTKYDGYHTFTIKLDDKNLRFKKYNEFIEFYLLGYGVDAHKMTDFAPRNLYYDEDYLNDALNEVREYEQIPNQYKKKKFIALLKCIAASFGIFVLIAIRDTLIRKKYTLCEPEMDMEYFRDIPSNLDPYFAANLVFSKEGKTVDIGDAYSAIILSLVRKGYIELKKYDPLKGWEKNNIEIHVLYKPASVVKNVFNTKIPNDSIHKHSAFINDANGSVTLGELKDPLLSKVTLNDYVSGKVFTPPPITNSTSYIPERKNINGKQLEELTENESAYFSLIKKYTKNDKIRMEVFQDSVSSDYINTTLFINKFEKSITDIGVSNKYFQNADYAKVKNSSKLISNVFMIIGFIILIFGNYQSYGTRYDLMFGGLIILGLAFIFGGIYLRKLMGDYLLLTQHGANEYAKWRALYNFLNSETLMNEKVVTDVILWEKYLVYATAFGISAKVSKALEVQLPSMYVDNSPILTNKHFRSSTYRNNCRSFTNSTYRAVYNSRSSSHGGFGGYSGFGGGGRGGGGGGGGH